jgi:hypothetical protein
MSGRPTGLLLAALSPPEQRVMANQTAFHHRIVVLLPVFPLEGGMPAS